MLKKKTVKYLGNYCVLYICVYTVIKVSILVDHIRNQFSICPISLSLFLNKKKIIISAAIVNINYKLCKKFHRNILLVNGFWVTSFFFYILFSIFHCLKITALLCKRNETNNFICNPIYIHCNVKWCLHIL